MNRLRQLRILGRILAEVDRRAAGFLDADVQDDLAVIAAGRFE
jgi:hypothetical protein